MKKKGFTLVELLVVIAIIALLMGILMPALARVRMLAYRVVCGTNLRGIGTAIMVYANDDPSGRYPRAGGRWGQWGDVDDWLAGDDETAFLIPAIPSKGDGGFATITSSLYLLVHHDYTEVKQFICQSDSDATELMPKDTVTSGDPEPLGDIWDFGIDSLAAASHCSYSYHMPYTNPTTFKNYALTSSREPGLAVAADRNPFVSFSSGSAAVIVNANGDAEADPPEFYFKSGDKAAKQVGNSVAHQNEGQNVLFNDIHVKFESFSFCGIEDDNIFTYWSDTDEEGQKNGTSPSDSSGILDKDLAAPVHRDDSLLVNEEGG